MLRRRRARLCERRHHLHRPRHDAARDRRAAVPHGPDAGRPAACTSGAWSSAPAADAARAARRGARLPRAPSITSTCPRCAGVAGDMPGRGAPRLREAGRGAGIADVREIDVGERIEIGGVEIDGDARAPRRTALAARPRAARRSGSWSSGTTRVYFAGDTDLFDGDARPGRRDRRRAAARSPDGEPTCPPGTSIPRARRARSRCSSRASPSRSTGARWRPRALRAARRPGGGAARVRRTAWQSSRPRWTCASSSPASRRCTVVGTPPSDTGAPHCRSGRAAMQCCTAWR